MPGDQRDGHWVDVDRMTAFRLRWREHWTVRSVDPPATELDPATLQIDVIPSQTEQLRPARARHGGEGHEQVQHRVVHGQVLAQTLHVRW